MKYLIAFGFVILIIVVQLVAKILIPPPIQQPGIVCTEESGFNFNCEPNIKLGTNGNLTFQFKQSTGATMYNIALACTSTANKTHQQADLHNPLSAMVLVYSNGLVSNVVSGNANTIVNPLTLVSGQMITISGLKCFNSNGAPFATAANLAARGTLFQGAIYMNYSNSSTLMQGTTMTQKTAEIYIKAV